MAAIRFDQVDPARCRRPATEQVVTHVADICTALVVDDHVVDVGTHGTAQVRMQLQRAVLEPVHTAILHRHDQWRAVRQKAETGRSARHFSGDFRASVVLDAVHLVRPDIRHPQTIVMPARALEEDVAVDERACRERAHRPRPCASSCSTSPTQ